MAYFDYNNLKFTAPMTIVIPFIVSKLHLDKWYLDESDESLTEKEFTRDYTRHMLSSYPKHDIWLAFDTELLGLDTLEDYLIFDEAIADKINPYLVVPFNDGICEQLLNAGFLVPIKEPEKMNTSIKEKGLTVVVANKSSAILAAQITVGKAANTLLIKTIKPKLPLSIRGFIAQESFSSKLLAANIAAVAVAQFMPDDPKAKAISSAMMHDAYLALADQFDIEAIMSEMFGKIKGKKVDQLIVDELD